MRYREFEVCPREALKSIRGGDAGLPKKPIGL